jgi:uncharacterized Tic20 family protein
VPPFRAGCWWEIIATPTVSHMTEPPAPSVNEPPVPPVGYANAEDKTWVLIAHFGGAAGMLIGFGCGGWLAPLIVFLVKGNLSPTVRAHAVNALNFFLLWSIIGVVCSLFGCILLFIPNIVVLVIGVVFGIIGGMRANEGQLYRYPMSYQLIK